jgi:hypothetical protein
MSQPFPVLFAIVSEEVDFAPGSPCSAAYASPVLDALIDAGELWSHTSRNWWHLGVINDLSQRMDLPGLTFLFEEECVTVRASELGTTVSSLSAMLDAFRDRRVPYEAIDDAWHSRVLREHPPEDVDGVPMKQSDDGLDTETRKAAASFYHFLASLRAVTSEAIAQRKRLLWIVPSP